MAALENARHERFAQEIAKGSSSRDAYGSAGYSTKNHAATDASASRLLSDARVQARIAEIKERSAIRAEVSLATVTESLLRIAQKGESLGEAAGLSVARAAQMDIAKLHGMVVDKSQSEVKVEVSDARERLARIVSGHAAARDAGGGAGKPH